MGVARLGLRPARIVLDTSAYTHLLAGHGDVVDWIARAEVVHVPAIVLGELEGGFRLGTRYAHNARTLDAFLEEPFVTVAPVTVEVARRYGEIFAVLRRNGTPIPADDLWIAATTLETGGHLVTFDRDFAAIAGLPHDVLSPV